jgi:hypothetical protein
MPHHSTHDQLAMDNHWKYLLIYKEEQKSIYQSHISLLEELCNKIKSAQTETDGRLDNL